MIFVKINNSEYPADVEGKVRDLEWDNRSSKTINCAMTYEEAKATFLPDTPWSILYQAPDYVDDNGQTVTPPEEVYDNSEYCVAGPITDNRDGTVSIKMGKKTDSEMLQELKEMINRGV